MPPQKTSVCPVEKCKIRQCVSSSSRCEPKSAPIAGTPSWAEVWVWGLEGQLSRPASCCLCGAGEAWVAAPGGPPVGGWRGCGAAAQACVGCSSRTRCKEAGSCSPDGSARPSCWRRSLVRWWAGGAGGHLRAALFRRLQTRCSGSGRRCRCCNCRRGRGSWRPGWLTGTRWARG